MLHTTAVTVATPSAFTEDASCGTEMKLHRAMFVIDIFLPCA
jgi:hypothetical protein